MAKVRPLTESGRIAARWQAQDSAFADQFERIRRLSGMTQAQIAAYLELSIPTLNKYTTRPDEMPKKVERKLVLLAEKVGVAYNPALGGGETKAALPMLAGIQLMIDPQTGYLKAMTS